MKYRADARPVEALELPAAFQVLPLAQTDQVDEAVDQQRKARARRARVEQLDGKIRGSFGDPLQMPECRSDEGNQCRAGKAQADPKTGDDVIPLQDADRGGTPKPIARSVEER